MTDKDPMPFGKYKGEKICNVPASHLLWLYNQGSLYGALKAYIEDNKELLEKEKSDDEKQKKSYK
jgi:uncharacterized protein (DUF3820 family)